MNNLSAVSKRVESPTSIFDYMLIPITALLGWISLILMMIFIYRGPLDLVDFGLTDASTLALNTFLSLAFFVQHSVMVRRSFRTRLRRFLDEKYLGALYTISSSLCLLLVVVFWRQSGDPLVYVQAPLRWVFRGVFYLSLAGIVWGFWSLGKFDAFGLEQLRNRAQGATTATTALLVRGPYRWVRHPLYLFCLLMIWAFPDLTADRLLFNILWTGWIVVGTVLEERDLVELFGAEYRKYQNQAPMLVPNSIRPIRWQGPALSMQEAK